MIGIDKVDIIRKHLGEDNFYDLNGTKMLASILNAMEEYANLKGIPSDEEFEKALDKEAFRVPYDGSDNFYDEETIKHWKKCWEWVKNNV